jgi:hypothetical protein
MHSMHLDLPEFGPVTIHHKGDWSGEAIIMWGWTPDPDYDGPHNDPFQRRGKYAHETRIEGEILIAIAKHAAVSYISSKLISVLEQIDPDAVP